MLKDLLIGYGKEGDKDTFSYGASESKRYREKGVHPLKKPEHWTEG